MNEKNKIRIGFAAFLFVVFHTLLICIYAAPQGVVPNRLKELSSTYVYPIFDQQWSMFAPCPTMDHEVEIRYQWEGGDSTGWIFPNSEVQQYHRWLRGSHHGELMLAEYNLLYWVSRDMSELGLSLNTRVSGYNREKFFGGYSYNMAKSYAFGMATYLFDKTPVHAEMRCHFHNVVTDEKGWLIIPEFKWKKR